MDACLAGAYNYLSAGKSILIGHIQDFAARCHLMFYFNCFSLRKLELQYFFPEEPEAVSESAQSRLDLEEKIRIVLADDHPVMRKGLRGIIEKQADMEVIGQASDGGEAVKMALDLEPDVVVMDVTMPVLDGIEATRRIISERPEICVIGLSMHEDPVLADEMRAAGALRCLTKSCPTEVLLDAIRYGAAK